MTVVTRAVGAATASEEEDGRMTLTEEPKALLVVVEDERGRQWYRWSAGNSHSYTPWATLGAVHGDTVSNPDYECVRWEDLPAVVMVSPGVTRDCYVASWRP